MADLNTVMEDSSGEARDYKTHNILPRNSILMNGLGGSNGIRSASRTRRQSSRTSVRSGYERRFLRYENTYQLEPEDEHKVDLIRVRRVATSYISSAIAGYKYDEHHAKQFSMTLAERIRNQMKQLPFPRYKIITQVTIGQKKGQDLRVASRCIWDLNTDRHITITKETLDAYVTVTIFFVYTE